METLNYLHAPGEGVYGLGGGSRLGSRASFDGRLQLVPGCPELAWSTQPCRVPASPFCPLFHHPAGTVFQ